MFDKKRVITLVSVTTNYDEIGQPVATETSTEVIAEMRSVSMTEWTNASQLGLSAEYEAIIWANEYDTQEFADIDGERYHIYRTYDTGYRMELYLERMVGHES